MKINLMIKIAGGARQRCIVCFSIVIITESVLLLIYVSSILYGPELKFSENKLEHSSIVVTFSDEWYNSERRLGNLLFGFALLFTFSKLTNRTIVIVEKLQKYRLSDCFQLNFVNSESLQRPRTFLNVTERFGPFLYDDEVLDNVTTANLSNVQSIFISGYFQSFKYHSGYENYLKKELQFRPEISNSVDRFWFEDVLSLKSKYKLNQVGFNYSKIPVLYTVGIHIRRTDMVVWFSKNTPDRFYHFGYLKKAVEQFANILHKKYKNRKKCVLLVFVVCTDDPVWAKKTMKKIDHVTYKSVEIFTEFVFPPVDSTEGFDLSLLSRCNGSIITVGSYGWWSAYLAGGPTVYYNKYPPGATNLILRDYYPANWIGLS